MVERPMAESMERPPTQSQKPFMLAVDAELADLGCVVNGHEMAGDGHLSQRGQRQAPCALAMVSWVVKV